MAPPVEERIFRGQFQVGLAAVALVGVAACESQPPRASANEQALRDIGMRNEDAGHRAAAEQRGRAKAQAEVREAGRREAMRVSEHR